MKKRKGKRAKSIAVVFVTEQRRRCGGSQRKGTPLDLFK